MIKVAICQLIGSQAKELAENKGSRKAEAEKFIREAAANGAQIVALPEMWLCPFGGHRFMEFAEEDGGETYQFMSALAKELGIYLVGGSIPEKSEDGT